jgi:lipoyl(octanoyl) transferase
VGASEFSTSTGRLNERTLFVCKLGLVDYLEAWNFQRLLAHARRCDQIPDVLLLLEHPHTYTLGRRGKPEHILLSPTQLKRREIKVYEVDRGGDVTYHGPEQLVGYPILKLPPDRLDYVRYIRDVERAMLLAVGDLGFPGQLKDGLSGVWLGDAKVGAIGVKIDAFGVTTHGIALNVNSDLTFFEHIIPCGIRDKGVTSLQLERGRRVSMDRAMNAVANRIAEAFELEPRGISKQRLAIYSADTGLNKTEFALT